MNVLINSYFDFVYINFTVIFPLAIWNEISQKSSGIFSYQREGTFDIFSGCIPKTQNGNCKQGICIPTCIFFCILNPCFLLSLLVLLFLYHYCFYLHVLLYFLLKISLISLGSFSLNAIVNECIVIFLYVNTYQKSGLYHYLAHAFLLILTQLGRIVSHNWIK